MLKLNFNGKIRKIPLDANELTINQVQQLMKIDMKQEKINIFCDIVNIFQPDLTYSDIEYIDSRTAKLILDSHSVALRTSLPKLKDTFELYGYVYKLQDLYNISYSQLSDLYNLSSNEDDIYNNIHIIIALCFRLQIGFKKPPLTFKNIFRRKKEYVYENYNSSKIILIGDVLKDVLTFDFCNSFIFFFLNLRMNYLQNLVGYTDKKKN